jgi:hypothetical protein
MQDSARLCLSSRVVQTDNQFHARAMDSPRPPLGTTMAGMPRATTLASAHLGAARDPDRYCHGGTRTRRTIELDCRVDPRVHTWTGRMDAPVPRVRPPRIPRGSPACGLGRVDLPARRPRSQAQEALRDPRKGRMDPRVPPVRPPGVRQGSSCCRFRHVDLPARGPRPGHQDAYQDPAGNLRDVWPARPGRGRR